MDAPEIIALIRDITIILVMLVAVILMVLLYWAITRLIKLIRRTADNITEISDKLVKPATAGSGAAFALGKLASFATGFANRKREKKGGNSDG